MQDQWENEIIVADNGTTRIYTRESDGMTIKYSSTNPNADLFAVNSFNGMNPSPPEEQPS